MSNLCLWCKKPLNGKSNQKRHPKCKKAYENSLRSGRITKKKTPSPDKKKPHSKKTNKNVNNSGFSVTKPDNLNPIASAYWDKVAPILIQRGHLNIISEELFIQLCEIYSLLVAMREDTKGESSTLVEEVIIWDNRTGQELESSKESQLSKNIRNYTKLFADLCDKFYLTPKSNRGDFGLEDENRKDDKKTDEKERFF